MRGLRSLRAGPPRRDDRSPFDQALAVSHAPQSAVPSADYASSYSDSFAAILGQCGVSLLLSTYQAGRLIAVSAVGDALHTHFVRADKPMGLAANPQRLMLATRRELREYYNVPALAKRIARSPPRDAVYALRNVHLTGDIDAHEVALSDDAVYYVNTLFSCLCRHTTGHSFAPIWRPPFVSSYAPEDRCHLNGLALRDGAPRWLTALGTSDQPQGWRANKASGGVLLDVVEHTIVTTGLSMPHSPRWHQGRLWLLESGKGSLASIDPESGRLTEVLRLPGFTRGLDFAGDYAFVGLSQLREPNAFAQIPLTENGGARACGVWVVDLRHGQIVGSLQFSGRVQELFAVSVLAQSRYPELIEADSALLDTTYALPDAALAELRLSPPSDDER